MASNIWNDIDDINNVHYENHAKKNKHYQFNISKYR